MKNILCFGDSNTWGYNPINGERYPWGIRWTSKLQEKLAEDNIHIIEQGLCGRTTVYEDISRPNRKGVDTLGQILSGNNQIDSVILMLGTNDCKTYYGNTAQEIAEGVDQCLNLILQHVSPEQVLLVSPIQLGEQVWKDEFDPEFCITSVQVSRELKNEYQKIAKANKVHFLAASEFASPSDADQEHMDVNGHAKLADAIYDSVKLNWQCA